MKIITKKHLIKTIAERWKSACFYQDYDGIYKWVVTSNEGAEIIYNKLLKLSKPFTEDKIAKIIGDYGWTKLHCNECNGNDIEMVVFFSDTFAERETTGKCLKCLKKAIALIEEGKP